MASSAQPPAMKRPGGHRASAVAVLLLLCTRQVFSHPVLDNQMLLDALSQEEASVLTSLLDDIELQSLRRFSRMTPFWRMVGSKPPGAYCLQGLECTTKLCRKGHCVYQQQFES